MADDRKRLEAERIYRQWLACGFKGEMRLDKYGWCTNGITFYESDGAKERVLFDKPRYRAVVKYMQFPNGKWIAGSSCTFPLHGWGHGLSIWCNQYETKAEAILSELNHIEKSLEDRDKKDFVLNGIQSCRNQFTDKEVEMAFEPSSQFEQTTLF